jgi:Tfp pilus assembly protein PilF
MSPPRSRAARVQMVVLAVSCAMTACSTAPAPEQAPPPKDAATPAKSRAAAEAAKEAPAPARPPPPKVVAPSKGEPDLQRGIKSYEDGEYKAAAKQLQSALDLGLDSKRDQAKAHKYLAFMVCVTGKEKACRDEFNKALDSDPNFQLDPAEAGHPIWGPALRSVKAERAKAKPK